MTLSQKLSEIREACIKANPKIMELKHGCYFRWNGDVWFINCERCEDGMIFAYSCTGDKHSWPLELGVGPYWDYKNKHFKRQEFTEGAVSFEILGRPIRLADILYTIENTGIYNCWFDIDGHNFETHLAKNPGPDVKFFNGIYNLKADDLTLQSEDCITFIHKILYEKE